MNTSSFAMKDLLTSYTETRECDYKGRHYSVRDNGSILRHRKQGCRSSKLDNVWTFGTKDRRTGYMLYGGVRVHQIVATAFSGKPEDPNMVIDHIDTNRCNNRPENLRWVTRLENVLNNPITRRRIESLCGSIEAFLKDPSKLRESASEPNTKWMRTVSKDEASKCLKNLSRWAEEDKAQQNKGTGEGIGEWIFNENKVVSDEGFGEPWDKDWHKRDYRSDYQKQMDAIEEENRRYYEEQYGLKESLSPGALQLNWKIPTEFPQCPQNTTKEPLQSYLVNLRAGVIFCYNNVYESLVMKAGISEDGQKIAVLCTTQGATDFALTEITYENGKYIHKNIRTFFTEDGAMKYYILSLGQEWTMGDVMEDYC